MFLAIMIEMYMRPKQNELLEFLPDVKKIPSETIAYFNSKVKIPSCYSIIFLIIINISIVHLLIAGGDSVSSPNYFLYLKFLFLFFLVDKAMQSKQDFFIVLSIILLGFTYIGYQVTINDAGYFSHGRLEGVGTPGAREANLLSCLIVTFLPVCGAMIFSANIKIFQYIAILGTPFIFNLLLLCNSRGAFLACFGAGFFLILFTKAKERKIVVISSILVILAAFLLLEDERIINRFKTTFASSEERDSSADDRLLFWKAAILMIKEYPLGKGGDAFKDKYSLRYLGIMGYETTKARAIHNGYLNEACEWGLQGLFLKLSLLFIVSWRTLKASQIYMLIFNDYKYSFLGKSLVAGMIAYSISTIFLDTLDAEWPLWLAAIMLFYIKDIKYRLTLLEFDSKNISAVT